MVFILGKLLTGETAFFFQAETADVSSVLAMSEFTSLLSLYFSFCRQPFKIAPKKA